MAGGSDFNYWLFERILLKMTLEIRFQLEYVFPKINVIIAEYANPEGLYLSG